MHPRGRVGADYVIGVESELQMEIYGRDYGALIESALARLGHAGLKIRFELCTPRTPAPPPGGATAQYARLADEAERARARPAERAIPSTMPLNENYKFSNFVQGPSNSFAYAAATAVAREPGSNSFNPLFIYGGTGLGKTHLMQSIGHFVSEKSPGKSVCFISSETFLNEYVNAIANNAMPAFRERYRKVDLLLLDDVQFIAGKRMFQEEFFNTFNSLMLTRKQIVMTSDVAPKNLSDCEERLIGRFQQGMVVEIESPSYETRLAILKSKAAASRHLVPMEILDFIAENIRSHVREIEGALNRVITFMDFSPHMALTVETARCLLKDSLKSEEKAKKINVDNIIDEVAKFYRVTREEIFSPARTQPLATSRQVAMFLCCKITMLPLGKIGDTFKRTHATVYHGAQAIQKRIDVEKDLREAVESIARRLEFNPADLTG